MNKLVDKYFDQIQVESTEYLDGDDVGCDAAYLLLQLPIQMLRDYQELRKSGYVEFPVGKLDNIQLEKLPEGVQFWKETGLKERLQESCKYVIGSYESLDDILIFLGGNVSVDYQNIHSSERIRMSITEIVEVDLDEQ